MRGYPIVLGLLAAGLAAAAGAAWYRAASRARLARELESPATRGLALTRLLRANGLWGLAREHVHDARAETPGRPYVRAAGAGGRSWHVVRCVKEAAGRTVPSSAVFSEDGKALRFVEASWPILLDGSETRGTAALIAERAEPGGAEGPSHAVLILGEELKEVLLWPGSFVLDAPAGVVLVGPGPLAGAPRFRYDPASGAFLGPSGGR
ncbi:MAG: hypothetical protein HY721_30295 [Planctomycetes bacterium]|nr:hypothetical protein [Planctomycetota bacterium]